MLKLVKYINIAVTLITAALGTTALIAAFMGQTHCFLTAAMFGGLTWAGMCSIDEINRNVAEKQNNPVSKGV